MALIYIVEDDKNIFKVFYKTNIIDQWEKDNAIKNTWKIYDIYSIYELFANIDTDSEVLGYYKEYIKKIYSAANREISPSEWGLISWHSFFNDYQTPECVSKKKEINCYQKEYFYIKLFVKGHENDMPCFEIRSRDLKCDENKKKCSIPVRVVLYNLLKQADEQTVKLWQDSLKKQGFKLTYRKDISTHKQLGTIYIENIDNTEKAMTIAFDSICELLSVLF